MFDAQNKISTVPRLEQAGFNCDITAVTVPGFEHTILIRDLCRMTSSMNYFSSPPGHKGLLNYSRGLNLLFFFINTQGHPNSSYWEFSLRNCAFYFKLNLPLSVRRMLTIPPTTLQEFVILCKLPGNVEILSTGPNNSSCSPSNQEDSSEEDKKCSGDAHSKSRLPR